MLFGRLGWGELVLILLVLLLIFGPSRIAQLGKSLGKGLREFRDAASRDTPGEKEEEKK